MPRKNSNFIVNGIRFDSDFNAALYIIVNSPHLTVGSFYAEAIKEQKKLYENSWRFKLLEDDTLQKETNNNLVLGTNSQKKKRKKIWSDEDIIDCEKVKDMCKFESDDNKFQNSHKDFKLEILENDINYLCLENIEEQKNLEHNNPTKNTALYMVNEFDNIENNDEANSCLLNGKNSGLTNKKYNESNDFNSVKHKINSLMEKTTFDDAKTTKDDIKKIMKLSTASDSNNFKLNGIQDSDKLDEHRELKKNHEFSVPSHDNLGKMTQKITKKADLSRSFNPETFNNTNLEKKKNQFIFDIPATSILKAMKKLKPDVKDKTICNYCGKNATKWTKDNTALYICYNKSCSKKSEGNYLDQIIGWSTI